MADALAEVGDAGLLRELRCVRPLEGASVELDGRRCVSFASCDYLGLARHPRLGEAAARAAREHGTSSGSARLLSGHGDEVSSLEHELARHFGAPTALAYGAGYLANLSVVTTLAGRGDLVLSDRLVHASAVDACRLSGAEVDVVPHGDVDAFAARLDAARARHRRILVLVDGLYSMDGDVAPLAELLPHVERAGALLVVDDAHGLGVLGAHGRGAVEACGVDPACVVQVGNLGKALGSYGAFVLADATVRDLLVQTSRGFVFTCALPPPVIAAAREALRVVRDEPERLVRVRRNARVLREALAGCGVEIEDATLATPIVPVLVGDAEAALAVSRRLLEVGWFVPAVRPPTVAPGTSRLRLTLTADHDEEQVREVARAVADALA
ncbi:MAG: 8-amino-7-oxononanoate synthase [Planctomycetes bacterium]|nr:8-amino-7-oxononanoate synthase [Planctomycetota bacterium]